MVFLLHQNKLKNEAKLSFTSYFTLASTQNMWRFPSNVKADHTKQQHEPALLVTVTTLNRLVPRICSPPLPGDLPFESFYLYSIGNVSIKLRARKSLNKHTKLASMTKYYHTREYIL